MTRFILEFIFIIYIFYMVDIDNFVYKFVQT
jgi:hypothetical protein